MRRTSWKTLTCLALLGALAVGSLTRRWVASTTVYIPSADRKLLSELAKTLDTQPVEQDTMEA
ncbi:MAG TPA: hypothetical protein PK129_15680, partial [Cellvibrionaceae bacterium]|nr:hypothetical protein [Cellvibrionaceae bacterium]